MRWAPEATVTTRSRTCGSSRLVSAKVPRWFVPIWSSNPSFVRRSGTAITPALLTRTSRSPSQASAKACTEARSARSSPRTSVLPGIEAAASRPRVRSRTASTTCAPARPRARAAARPMPLLAPVTTKVRPRWSGRSCAVHLAEVMPPPWQGAGCARARPLAQRLAGVLDEHEPDRVLVALPAGVGEALALVEAARPYVVARGVEPHAPEAALDRRGERAVQQLGRQPCPPPRRA